MHRWSPHCALGWLQAELEEAEQEAEVRGGPAGPGTAGRETRPIIPPNPPPAPASFLYCRVESPSSRKPTLSAWPQESPPHCCPAVLIGQQGSSFPRVNVSA